MDELQNGNNPELIHYEPELSVNFNEDIAHISLHPVEELEEDMFDYETDISLQDINSESKEQVVPSSQLSNSHKYPEELTSSDDEVDEGIFEDEASSNLVLLNDNTHNSEPP
ncbi:uncharacterized protein LOC116432928 isoform X2 [Nomia melanderi]|uniref:uncharacterized protein LOC116432928 isoform X2 n=1 Tax=Nomia melanderi TaxID=2448451 RepID=UPI0013046EBB|nr:uncharacterized protein LOC116432928 isoform X2 [Nomia melanderi]XP_031846308.1 uncharacterized protein LOC116432928 isoform X2 [Nomia melanderi]XP_031846309.1 uncharacterized protein LOC116432928 isoform X2 [Nomia melanderi]